MSTPGCKVSQAFDVIHEELRRLRRCEAEARMHLAQITAQLELEKIKTREQAEIIERMRCHCERQQASMAGMKGIAA